MKGLELAKNYYDAYGRPMIEREFADYAHRIAVGLAGEGSECFGFDDEISKDHDFGPSFCMWLTEEDYNAVGSQLTQYYNNLPKEFSGIKSRHVSAMGKGRRGPMRIGTFYSMFTKCESGPASWQEWFRVPEHLLAAAVNGEVFRDDLGRFSSIRRSLQQDRPEDVRKKKIAAKAVKMAQSGQYNFLRCIRHQEEGAALFALTEFVQTTIQMVFLLNRSYCPYYKWMFRALKTQVILSGIAAELEKLLITPNISDNLKWKTQKIEEICWTVIQELRRQKLTDGQWDYLEPHAFRIMDTIEMEEIRKLHVMLE